MKFYGDICQMNGAELAKVDVITFGAPCQDLSVAGLRKGMLHQDHGDSETTRSGLFFEAIRIIKEMRDDDYRRNRRTNVNIRPRYAVYENVTGAFSSNEGRDFQAVLTELIKIADPETPDVPLPEKGWSKSGVIYDELGKWSVAWRTHDSQWWGVPQRRKRICVLADFGGLTAWEILFDPQLERTTESGEPVSFERNTGAECRPEIQTVSESLSGDSEQSEKTGEETARVAGTGSDTTGKCLNGWDVQSKHIQPTDGIAESLYAGEARYGGGESYVLEEPILLESNQNHATIQTDGVCTALPAAMGEGGGYVPMVVDEPIPINSMVAMRNASEMRTCMGVGEPGDPQFTISATQHHAVFVKGTRPHSAEEGQEWKNSETANTLNTNDTGESRANEIVVEAYGISSFDSNAMKSPNPNSGIYKADTARTLDLNGGSPACNQGGMIVLEGNGQRESHQGDGYKECETMYTLNTIEQHAVCYGLTTKGNGETILTEEKHMSLSTGGGQAGQGYPACLVLNDQGGGVMEVSEEKTGTLRAENHGHPPLIAYGIEPGAAQRMNPEGRITEELSPTLRANAGDNQAAAAVVYENHSQDTRYKELGDVCQTVSATFGMGGNNTPLVCELESDRA